MSGMLLASSRSLGLAHSARRAQTEQTCLLLLLSGIHQHDFLHAWCSSCSMLAMALNSCVLLAVQHSSEKDGEALMNHPPSLSVRINSSNSQPCVEPHEEIKSTYKALFGGQLWGELTCMTPTRTIL